MTGITIYTGIFQGNLRKFKQMLKIYFGSSGLAGCLRLANQVVNCPLLRGPVGNTWGCYVGLKVDIVS